MDSADQLADKHIRLDAHLKGLRVMEQYFGGVMNLPLDPHAGSIPQSHAFEMHESIGRFIGPLTAASRNYDTAADTLKYYARFILPLAHEANTSAWTLLLRRAQAQAQAEAQKAAMAAPKPPRPPAQAHATPPGVKLPSSPPQGFPSVEEQLGKEPCPGCHGPVTPKKEESLIPEEYKNQPMTDEQMKQMLRFLK